MLTREKIMGFQSPTGEFSGDDFDELCQMAIDSIDYLLALRGVYGIEGEEDLEKVEALMLGSGDTAGNRDGLMTLGVIRKGMGLEKKVKGDWKMV